MKEKPFFGKTDTGKQRQNNEDELISQYIWDDGHILGVAIDGVGGYEGGEVASEIAKTTIVEYLEKHPNGERLNLLKQAVVEANNKIVSEARQTPKLANMSCVLSACLAEVEKKQINMVHIGDTRVYQFRKGELKKLSSDHSDVGYREDIGVLTEEEAMNHPRRNEINRLLGEKEHQIDDRDFIEAKTFPLLPNTTLLLCSDGLTDLVTKAEISAILNTEKSLEEKTEALIKKANDKGGKDNITAVLIDYKGDEVDNIENIEVIKPLPEKTEQPKPRKKSVFRKVLALLLALLLGIMIGFGIANYISKDTIADRDERIERLKNVIKEISEMKENDTNNEENNP